MIKIIKATYVEGYTIALEFSDGKYAVYDFSSLVAKKGSLVQPLRDKAYFKAFFLEMGAMCWKNGLELSPHALYENAKEQGLLSEANFVA